jgi:hypothetical protein
LTRETSAMNANKKGVPLTQTLEKPAPKLTPTAAQVSAMSAALEQRRVFDSAVRTIAQQLGETAREPLRQLKALVAHIGIPEAQRFLAETLETEAQGGLLVSDGSRPRTRGGIFFYLVRTKGPKEVKRLFYARPKPKAPSPPPTKRLAAKASGSTKRPPTSAPFTWATRIAVLDGITTSQEGTLQKMKISLMGRPSKVVNRGSCVVTSMRGRSAPDLPAGLPLPPRGASTSYTIYMTGQQWAKVKTVLDSDPQDLLLIDGWPHYDEEAGGIAVFAERVLTRKQQQQRRAMQQVAVAR